MQGDYQRQLFLIDHAGLPLKTVLEQLDLLGEEVVPVLRKEFATGRPDDVPAASTHQSLLQAAREAGPAGARAAGRGRAGVNVRTLAIVTGGLREPSSTRLLADRLVAAVGSSLAERDIEVDASFVELRHVGRASMDAMLTGFATAPLEEAFEMVADADGLIAVTPAFNASFSGLFKCFFDVLPEEALADMPVLIGATGGTERHSLVLEHALRPMFSYLHAIVSPRGVYAATDDFGTQQGSALGERITAAAADYSRLLEGCGPRRGVPAGTRA